VPRAHCARAWRDPTQFNLGKLLLEGKLVAPDYARAAALLRAVAPRHPVARDLLQEAEAKVQQQQTDAPSGASGRCSVM